VLRPLSDAEFVGMAASAEEYVKKLQQYLEPESGAGAG